MVKGAAAAAFVRMIEDTPIISDEDVSLTPPGQLSGEADSLGLVC